MNGKKISEIKDRKIKEKINDAIKEFFEFDNASFIN